MKRKSLMLLLATTVVASMMLTGCGETASSAGAEVSTDASIEAATEASSEKTSDVEAATEATSAEDADALNSSESTSSTSNSSADEAATAISVPEFSSADEEEQWVLEQISGVWETCYKPAELCNIEGTEVSYYGNNWYGGNHEIMDEYSKSEYKSTVKYIGKSSDENGKYYEIEFSDNHNRPFYWYYENYPDMLTAMNPYSASDSFERPYGYSNENIITIDDYKIIN